VDSGDSSTTRTSDASDTNNTVKTDEADSASDANNADEAGNAGNAGEAVEASAQQSVTNAQQGNSLHDADTEGVAAQVANAITSALALGANPYFDASKDASEELVANAAYPFPEPDSSEASNL
jgi:hypothetical protein